MINFKISGTEGGIALTSTFKIVYFLAITNNRPLALDLYYYLKPVLYYMGESPQDGTVPSTTVAQKKVSKYQYFWAWISCIVHLVYESKEWPPKILTIPMIFFKLSLQGLNFSKK